MKTGDRNALNLLGEQVKDTLLPVPLDDALACALLLAGDTPTPDELAAALAELYPSNTGPTVQ